MAKDKRIEFAEMIEKTGLIRLEISKYLGVHQRTIYRYLSGELEIPTSVMLAMRLLTKGK